MQRREFFTVAGAIAGQYQTRNAERRTRNRMLGQRFRVPTSDFRVIPDQEPALSPEVFARRLERVQQDPNTVSMWTPPPLMKLSIWGRAKGRFAVIMIIAFLNWSSFMR